MSSVLGFFSIKFLLIKIKKKNSQPIAQFEENKVSVHSVSSPTLIPGWWSHLEQRVENLEKVIQGQI